MQNKLQHVNKEERKTILLLCDDIRLHSGIATMAKEFVVGSAHHFNWVNLGGALNHPNNGKLFDVSEDVNKQAGIKDASVKILANTGYGDANKLRQLLATYSPDAIMIFTDPRYWTWLFDIEREIRTKIPICYLNIWDEYPAPYYNKSFYESCDLLMGISKQTVNINKIVLGDKAKDKVIKYVPHGINPNHFFPITGQHENREQFDKFHESLFPEKPEFVVFWNSRNIQRKRPADVILAYRQFCDIIGPEKARKCALLMHTQPKDSNGTDLYKVRDLYCNPEENRVYFSTDMLQTAQMNLLYNIADVTVLASSNEGWGLSLTESMMAGTMIIPNTTGGMQDQARFTDDNGKWIEFTPDFPSNHRGTYKQHGEWAEPVFPSNISSAGSITTPYIFDSRCSSEDIANAILKVYNLTPEERTKRGQSGRNWVMSEESGMSSTAMSNNVIDSIEDVIKNFTPRKRFDLIKVEALPRVTATHKVTGY